jgi:hypothetical protein
MPITNPQILAYSFLEDMYSDEYFPPFLVDKIKAILLTLCEEIESKKPTDLPGLYELTHAAVEKINLLEDEFLENESELETGAREAMSLDFDFIATAYGFDADPEDLIENREW